MSIGPFGLPTFRFGVAGQAGEWPAFQFRAWEAGILTKLPKPERSFGLDLHSTRVTDAGLKELAALKQLQTLNLAGTGVTDAGLKYLAPSSNSGRWASARPM